jgi:hypothetical protein
MLIPHLTSRERQFQKKIIQIFVDKQQQQEDGFIVVSLDESLFSFMILSDKKGLD